MQRLDHRMGQRDAGATHRIYLLSDLHIGHRSCHKKLLERHIRRIAEDADSSVFLGGDVLDSVPAQDKRYAESAIDESIRQMRRDDTINAQAEMAAEMLAPIKHKVRGCIIGNHEHKIVQVASADPLKIVCTTLGIDHYDGSYCGYYRLIWSGPTSGKLKGQIWFVDVMLHHGAGGGAMIGAKANRVDRRASWWSSADIVASGHNHARSIHPHTVLSVPPPAGKSSMRVEEKTQWCLNTGSYLKSFEQDTGGSHYAERWDLPPSDLGGAVVHVALGKEPRGDHNMFTAVTLRGEFL